jgi:hypothetical protein
MKTSVPSIEPVGRDAANSEAADETHDLEIRFFAILARAGDRFPSVITLPVRTVLLKSSTVSVLESAEAAPFVSGDRQTR